MPLSGKKIILAISGSIAAYKTPELVRQFVKMRATVRVVATPAALQFVSELSLATVSKNEVYSTVQDGASWNNHVELGLWADALIVAPCTANTLGKFAGGLCDNIVSAVYLSARCPVFLAPAMDDDMWRHPAVKRNIQLLRQYGNHILPVGFGELASGLIGSGRMADPAEIVQYLHGYFLNAADKPLKGAQALVTAGPTYERLDPVRFIGNFSTGKMGYAVAEALADKGATVTLVSGPTQLQAHHPNVHVVRVESAREMHDACMQSFPDVQIAVMAAAVADYRPKTVADTKIKKQGDAFHLDLEKTPDILSSLGRIKNPGQTLIGFALETDNEEVNALGKLHEKNADYIVLNSLKDEGAGFGTDTNKVTILSANGGKRVLPLQSKAETAVSIINYVLEYATMDA